MFSCFILQADIEPPPRQPSKFSRAAPPAPPPPPPAASSPRASPRQSAAADVHIVLDSAGMDTIRQSFEPPPAVTHVVSDTAGSDTIRESFEPSRSYLTQLVNDVDQYPHTFADQQVAPAVFSAPPSPQPMGEVDLPLSALPTPF